MRVPRFAIALSALVFFGFAGLASSSRALAQSNVPAGTPLFPSAIGPLSTSPPAVSTAPSTGLTTLAPLSLPAPIAPLAPAPGAPAALATTSALPVLNPAPLVVAGGPTPVPQSIFTCSCFGVGLGTR